MNHFVHCCSFSTSNKITSKGRVHHRRVILMQKMQKFSGEGAHPLPTPHTPGASILTPPILKFCLRYWDHDQDKGYNYWLGVRDLMTGIWLTESVHWFWYYWGWLIYRPTCDEVMLTRSSISRWSCSRWVTCLTSSISRRSDDWTETLQVYTPLSLYACILSTFNVVVVICLRRYSHHQSAVDIALNVTAERTAVILCRRGLVRGGGSIAARYTSASYMLIISISGPLNLLVRWNTLRDPNAYLLYPLTS